MIRPLLLAGCLLMLAACVPALPEALPTQSPAATQAPSPTVVWFPPTGTPAPVSTPRVVPTANQRPAIGAIVLADDFSTPGQWNTLRSRQGSVAFGLNELTIALAEPLTYLASLRKGNLPADFYLSITTHASLCRGADAYGLLLRAATLVDTYRLQINCNGQVRLERIKNSKIAILQDWTPSGQVPPGSPLTLRLGAWVVKNELRFFINDIYQFSARDAVLPIGGVGVFARSGGKNALTVSFSNLEVSAIEAGKVPTATQTPAVTPTRGAPTASPTY